MPVSSKLTQAGVLPAVIPTKVRILPAVIPAQVGIPPAVIPAKAEIHFAVALRFRESNCEIKMDDQRPALSGSAFGFRRDGGKGAVASGHSGPARHPGASQ